MNRLGRQSSNNLVAYLRRSVQVTQGRTYAGGLTKFEPREVETSPGSRPRLTRTGGPFDMNQPPRWSDKDLGHDVREATEIFRKERLEEPLEDYLEAFDECLGNVEDLFETTIDLAELDETAIQFLTDQKLFGVFRYLPGPPISDDDLKRLPRSSLSTPHNFATILTPCGESST